MKEEPFAFMSPAFESRIHIFVRGNDSKVYYKFQETAKGAWVANWVLLDGITANFQPVAAVNTNGSLMVFAVGSRG